jgi:hypothetical protein
MSAVVKSALTLFALAGVTLVGAIWGWHAFTEPLPGSVDPAVCTDSKVAAGSKIYPRQVTVSVFNASDRDGLAGRTLEAFVTAGFAPGASRNAPNGSAVRYAEIWVGEVDDPAAALVQTYLGKRATVVTRTPIGPGVTVVVGEDFGELRKGSVFMTASRDTTVCSPLSVSG